LEVHLVYHEKSADIEPSQVAAEVVAKFPVLELYEVRLNHRHILAAIWAWAGVKQADRRSVAQLLAVMGGAAPRSSARKALWPLVRRQLLQVLSSQMIFQGMVFSGICTDVGLRA
jgi:histidyl-tRNA synthetase